MVIKYDASASRWYAYAFNPNDYIDPVTGKEYNSMNPYVDWSQWRNATPLSTDQQALYQLGDWPPASVEYPTAPQVNLAEQLPLVQSPTVNIAPQLAAVASTNTGTGVVDSNTGDWSAPPTNQAVLTTSTATYVDQSAQDLLAFKAGLKFGGSTTKGVTFVSTMADDAVKNGDLTQKSFLANPAALQDRGAG
jgi:hypothetical protein